MLYKGEIPFVRLILPLVAGILSAYYFSSVYLFKIVPILSSLVFSLLLFSLFSYRKLSLYKLKWVIGVALHFLIAMAGYWITIETSERFSAAHFSLQQADALAVEITSEPKITKSISRFEARVAKASVQNRFGERTGKIIISINGNNEKIRSLNYGDVLLMPAKFGGIDPPYNPGEFDYKGYLADRQIYYQAFLQPDEVYVIAKNRGNPFISFALVLRKQLVEKFYFYLPDKEAAAFASTLILGYRAELSSELVEVYSKTGTMHALSVSGMHVGIVFLVLSFVLKFMNKTQSARVFRAVLIITIIWFYALITGFSAPACRAAMMLSLVVLGKALNKSQNTYNLIAISAFFLLLYNPFYIVDAGFQLSYLAVIGIVFFHPKIYQSIDIRYKFLDQIWSYCALSIAAQIATFPFSVYYFHQFPAYFLLSNLLIVLPIAVIMYSGILFMFIPFSALLHFLGQFLSSLINYTNGILFYIENLPFSSWDGIWINVFECSLLCILIILVCIRLVLTKTKVSLAIAGAALLLVLSISYEWLKVVNKKQLIFYNLKKKSGFAYIFQNQSILVSDVNPGEKVLNYSLLPAVKSQGSEREIFYNTTDSFAGKSYFGYQNFYQFGSCRMVKWDKSFDYSRYSRALTVDIVLLSGNPNVSLKDIAACMNFKRIVIDANNPDYKIHRWVSEAKGDGYEYYVLKKNPALILNL